MRLSSSGDLKSIFSSSDDGGVRAMSLVDSGLFALPFGNSNNNLDKSNPLAASATGWGGAMSIGDDDDLDGPAPLGASLVGFNPFNGFSTNPVDIPPSRTTFLVVSSDGLPNGRETLMMSVDETSYFNCSSIPLESSFLRFFRDILMKMSQDGTVYVVDGLNQTFTKFKQDIAPRLSSHDHIIFVARNMCREFDWKKFHEAGFACKFTVVDVRLADPDHRIEKTAKNILDMRKKNNQHAMFGYDDFIVLVLGEMFKIRIVSDDLYKDKDILFKLYSNVRLNLTVYCNGMEVGQTFNEVLNIRFN